MFFLDYLVQYNRYLNIVGILAVLGIAFLFSSHRSRISFKLVVSALCVHAIGAFIILRTVTGQTVAAWLGGVITKLYQAADGGISFVFGKLSDQTGLWGHVFAFKVLPVIIFFGAVMALLSHLGIIQRIVGFLSWIVRPLFGTSGAETLCAVANSFLGQTEAPLLIRNYLDRMTRSEMLLVMVSGMGTISAALLAVYDSLGVPIVHLLCASLIGVPATILIAKMLCPETETAETRSGVAVDMKVPSRNVIDAVSQGTSDGLWLALNIGAMLIAFIALIGMTNGLLGWCIDVCNEGFAWGGISWRLPMVTLESICGVLFAPVAWLMGLSGNEMTRVGELIGLKLVGNEMIGYLAMLKSALSERTIAIATYALCGFANISSIGIQLGGIGVLAPSKRGLLSELGMKAVLGGTLANLLSAFVAGLLI